MSGYVFLVFLAVILSIPILVATAIGGIVGRMVKSRSTGCWTSAGLGALFWAGLLAAYHYYNMHLAGRPPQPAPPLGEIASSIAVGGGISGILSFFLCRVMR